MYLKDINNLKSMKVELVLSPNKMGCISKSKKSTIPKNSIQAKINFVALFAL